jgi:succinate dehydrogenase/fumarate reductase cytochrome b subunit
LTAFRGRGVKRQGRGVKPPRTKASTGRRTAMWMSRVKRASGFSFFPFLVFSLWSSSSLVANGIKSLRATFENHFPYFLAD